MLAQILRIFHIIKHSGLNDNQLGLIISQTA